MVLSFYWLLDVGNTHSPF